MCLLGWFGVSAVFFAENAHSVFSMLFDITISTKVLAGIGGLLMMTTAIYGYQAINKLSKFSVPLLIGFIVLAMFLSVKKEGMDTVTQSISEDIGIGAATSLVNDI